MHSQSSHKLNLKSHVTRFAYKLGFEEFVASRARTRGRYRSVRFGVPLVERDVGDAARPALAGRGVAQQPVGAGRGRGLEVDGALGGRRQRLGGGVVGRARAHQRQLAHPRRQPPRHAEQVGARARRRRAHVHAAQLQLVICNVRGGTLHSVVACNTHVLQHLVLYYTRI